MMETTSPCVREYKEYDLIDGINDQDLWIDLAYERIPRNHVIRCNY